MQILVSIIQVFVELRYNKSGASGNVDAAIKYTFAKGKALLTLRCNDIFETGQISPRIHFATQNVTNNYSCFREFGVSFTYKFGGYKEKQREAVDTSRFK